MSVSGEGQGTSGGGISFLSQDSLESFNLDLYRSITQRSRERHWPNSKEVEDNEVKPCFPASILGFKNLEAESQVGVTSCMDACKRFRLCD